MRILLHYLTATALLTAFGQSPFAHIHEHASSHALSHSSGHSHWALHEDHDHPVWEAEEETDDAKFINWLAGDGSIQSSEWIVFPSEQCVVKTLVEISRIEAPSPRNHDPPACSSLPARSPPAKPASNA